MILIYCPPNAKTPKGFHTVLNRVPYYESADVQNHNKISESNNIVTIKSDCHMKFAKKKKTQKYVIYFSRQPLNGSAIKQSDQDYKYPSNADFIQYLVE